MVLMGSGSTSPNTMSFADVLRERTAHLHRHAEQSGVVAEIISGRITRASYGCFLRNLMPAYEALESGLERHRNVPGMSGLFRPEVFRANAIANDLSTLCGAAWRDLSVLPTATNYAQRIAAVTKETPKHLIAHAYTRYLGDLGGGRILQRLLESTLKLDERSRVRIVRRSIWRQHIATIRKASSTKRSSRSA